jgi:hypothetical protein
VPDAKQNSARLSHVRDVTKYVPGNAALHFDTDMPSAAKAALLCCLYGTAEAVLYHDMRYTVYQDIRYTRP